MISQFLPWILAGSSAVLFTLVGCTGFVYFAKSLSQHSSSSIVAVLLWTHFLFMTYFACLSWESVLEWIRPALMQGLDMTVQVLEQNGVNVGLQWNATWEPSALPAQAVYGSYILPTSITSSPFASLFNLSFSHTLCLILGVLVSFGQGSFYNGLERKMVIRWPDGTREILEAASEVLFHSHVWTGCFVWFKYGFPWLVDDASAAFSTREAIVLALSHTLSFSLGVFHYKDYMQRQASKLEKARQEAIKSGKKPSDKKSIYYIPQDSQAMAAYTGASLLMIGTRLGWQYYSKATPMTSLDDMKMVAFVSMGVYMVLRPSRSLWAYGLFPASVLGFTGAKHLWNTYQPINTSMLALFVGGITAGVLLTSLLMKAAGYSRVPTKVPYKERQAASRRHRARKYPSPYPKGWYRLYGSHEIKRGELKHVHCLGLQFAVFRGNDSGEISVTDAFCPHLGANMAVGGTIVGDRIRCPFHGWEFEGKDGQCAHIPYRDDVPSVAKVKTWPVYEYGNIIYLYYDPFGQPPTYYPDRFENIDNGTMRCIGESSEQVELHLQDVAENGADWMHFQPVHGRIASIPFVGRFTHITHKTDVHFPEDKKYYMEFSDIPKVYSIFNLDKPMLPDNVTSTVGICGPSSIMYFKFHTPLGTVMLIKTFLPHRAMEVTMTDSAWADKTVPLLLAKYIIREASVNFGEDILIWNLKAYPTKPIYLKEDIAIKKVRQWYAQFYQPDPNLPLPGKKEVEQGQVELKRNSDITVVKEKQDIVSSTKQTFIESLPGCPGVCDMDW